MNTLGTNGQNVAVTVQLDSQGDEAATSFTANWNPAVLTYVTSALGTGVPSASNLALNTNQIAQGRLGVLIDSTNPFAAGTRQILTVTFAVAANAPAGVYPVGFTGAPTPLSVSSPQGGLLATTYDNGNVLLGLNEPGRLIRSVSRTAQAGQTIPVIFQLDSQGDEASASFTANWNPAVFTYVSAVAGTGVPAGTNLGLNTSQTAQGKLGVLLDSTNRYNAGTRGLLTLTLTVAANAPASTYPITFTATPTAQSVSSDQGVLLATTYETGSILLSPTAAGVLVSGRITNSNGQGVRGATVVITDSTGNRRTVTTGSFGFYTFDDVEAGQSYVIGVSAKRYRFGARVVNVTDSLSDVDFVGLE